VNAKGGTRHRCARVGNIFRADTAIRAFVEAEVDAAGCNKVVIKRANNPPCDASSSEEKGER